ncbi:Sts1 protein [Xylariaceae sp. AK1471]|nr:Sts1 protein [Xylariaceae sp. AK1471]
MNVLLSPQPSFFHHPHEANRRSPTRSMSPFHNTMSGHRKRKAEDEGDEMSVSPSSSPAVQSRQLSRPSKKVRSSDPTGRPLSLPRLLETLDVTQLRTVLQTICERQPEIGEEVVKSAPRPSVECALQVLNEYQDKLRAAFPYGGSNSDYTYFRVKQPLLALIDALTDFTPQYLPPNEAQAAVSLQYLDGATKFVHNLPEWESQSYRYHKENAYDEISKAWALVIVEASKKGAGFALHSDGWDQILAKHNQQSGGRLHTAMAAMAANVGWVGGNPNSGTPNSSSNQASILDQLVAGNYVSPVRVGPCPGDQHSGIANPFEEVKPRISEFTATEIATLQARLEKQLGPEYLSARSGPSGQKVHYIAAEKCIALANEVFGFNGWSSSIQNIQVDFVDENPQTLKISLGLSVIVRVTLRDGTFHEDIGYGHIENCKGKAAAFEKAKKEGTTDALKRTLRNFGNVLGNCIYDKDYLAKVTKIKVGPTKFDEENLHRHADFVKKEQSIVKVEPKAVADGANASALEEDFGDFDMADFGVTEDGHPDEGRPNAQQQPPRHTSHANTTSQQAAANSRMMTPPPNAGSRPPTAMNAPNGASNEPATFFSARSVKDVPEHADPGTAVLGGGAKIFDPRAESPSIRKTPGIDHKSSKPLSRTGVHVQPLKREPEQQRPTPNGPPNVVNPSLAQMRQIGAPGGAGSPLGNRGQYRPPTMKRPAPNGPDGGNGTPLTEVSTNRPLPAAGAGAIGADAKRQKMA